MSEAGSRAARLRYQQEATAICPHCKGSGLTVNRSVTARAKKGGNASYLKNLDPKELSMSERGRRGGPPPMPTIQELERDDQGPLSEEPSGQL